MRKSSSSATSKSRPHVNLKSLRHKIDRLDRDILKLLNTRAALANQIGHVKDEQELDVYSPGREEQIIVKILEDSRGPLDDRTVRVIFRELMSGCRAMQKSLKVAYLGPEYSFSHLAAVEKFGEAVEFVPVGSIAAVFEQVNRGHADFGIVPIENSTDGRIADTLDMFTRLPLKVCAEVRLRIHHNLLAKCPQAEIRRVYSKPQALSQCRNWLAKNVPQAQLIDVASTATAARLAQQEPGAAAVASRQAASKYELNVVAATIEDIENNITRFAVIGHQMADRTGNDKTALMFQIPHKPGSLHEALGAFRKNKVNLTWIESFPAKGGNQEYLFFLDFEGHVTDARIKRLLMMLQRKAERLVVLGSYPKSECYD